MNDAVARDEVERAVHFERRAYRVSRRQVDEPCKSEFRNTVRVDLCERAVMLPAVGAARAGPVLALAAVFQTCGIRIGGIAVTGGEECRAHECRNDTAIESRHRYSSTVRPWSRTPLPSQQGISNGRAAASTE